MIKLKLAGFISLLLVPMASVSMYAFLSLPVSAEITSAAGSTGVVSCPCPPPSYEWVYEDDGGGSGDDSSPEDIYDPGGSGGTDDEDNGGSEGTDDADSGSGDDGDDGNDPEDVNDPGDDKGTDDEDNGSGDDGGCGHNNSCPKCGDCLDCGNDPCPECCDDGRKCDECILCTFNIGMTDGKLQYTGEGLLGFNGGIIHKGESAEGYWVYKYTPVSGTGAQLDNSGLPLSVGQYTVTGTYDNGKYNDSKTSMLTVTPAPLQINVTLERKSKVYDGTTDVAIQSAVLTGILADDTVEITIMGTAAYASANAGTGIAVSFTDFEIGGTHANNYYLIQPEDHIASITRAPYTADILININDDPLRIGSELSFSASADPSGYLVQWRVDGNDADEADDITYTIRPEDADKRISVAIVSPCRNYEGVSPPTAYVPYTITVSMSDTVIPMEKDDVYFGTPGNYTAYAASKYGGFADIDYVLEDSNFGTDHLEYTGVVLSSVTGSGTGKSRYFANPDDAVNGVIAIQATMYHRGVAISPEEPYTFEPIECGSDNDEIHKVTITQLGNAPTGPIYISKNGDYPYEYAVSSLYIHDIGIGSDYELDIHVDLGSSLPGFSGHTYTASVDIAGKYIFDSSIPLSVTVNHDFSDFIYQDGYHEHECKGCGLDSRGDCIYSSWADHARFCGICFGVSSHTADWSQWAHGTESRHSRSCEVCDQDDDEDHAWNPWASQNSTQHRRDCPVCTRQDTASHAWNGTHTATQHRCGACSLLQNHAWSGGSHTDSQHRCASCTFGVNHTWNGTHNTSGHQCGTCSRRVSHTWSGGSHTDSQHRCATCTYGVNHTWNGTHNSSGHQCGTCSRRVSHTWSGGSHTDTQHNCASCTYGVSHTWDGTHNSSGHQCGTCSRRVSHTWRNNGRWENHTCSASGCGRTVEHTVDSAASSASSTWPDLSHANLPFHNLNLLCAGCGGRIWDTTAHCFFNSSNVCIGSGSYDAGTLYRLSGWPGCGFQR